ncbi:DUF1285 domain-containing protein [Sphingomonas sp. MMS24-J13]|uniref:DUF1285 domain-containing protein n=1 Tax=Sphingomonas sp. MMS24-J13 TaxID=3238686 RepID=UPI00384E2AAC
MPERAPPPPDLSALSLAEIAQAASERRLPPVDRWNPEHCGDSAMRIARDGTWYHEGSPIGRPAMVRLFASLLRREADGRFVLVTPVEKLDIAVETCPFVAVEVQSEGEGRARRLAFRLNTDEPIIAGPAHALRIEDGQPLLQVRPGLDALIARPVYYELAEFALAEGVEPPGLWSDGAWFPLEAS